MTPAAARIWRALIERGPLPVVNLALEVGMRRSAVRAELEAFPERFIHNGKRARASAWDVRCFDVAGAAEHFGVSVECADEYLFGERGFLGLGLVKRLNGDGRLVVSDLGLEFSHDVQSWLGPAKSARLPALPPTPARGGVSARKESAYV